MHLGDYDTLYIKIGSVLNGTQINKIKSGTLDLILDDEASNGINIEYGIPQTDTQGLNNTPYTFRVINNGEISMTARGAYAKGEDVYLWKNKDGSYEFVPENGANGSSGYASSGVVNNPGKDVYCLGNKGLDGTERKTGKGGAGGNGSITIGDISTGSFIKTN